MLGQAAPKASENGSAPPAAGSPAAEAPAVEVEEWVLQAEDASPAAAASSSNGGSGASLAQKYDSALRVLHTATANAEVGLAARVVYFSYVRMTWSMR